jgi:tRNA threonylcarbamoyladenosine biosynthesis protein TsaB
MNILAINTTSQYYSFSLKLSNEPEYFYLEEKSWQHAELLLEKINQFYTKLEKIDIIAITNGPGSFTGIRIGLAIAKGFQLVFPNLKIITPSNFQIMANMASEIFVSNIITVIIDAKRDEFVIQQVNSSLEEIGNMINVTSEKLNEYIQNANSIVTDSEFVKDMCHVKTFKLNSPISSSNVLETAIKMQNFPPSTLEAIYFRRPDATPMQKG